MATSKHPSYSADLITFTNSQGEEARGSLLKLSRSEVVLEVYNPYSIVQLSEVLSDVNIYRHNQVIYNGRAIVSNLVNTGIMLIISANLVDPWLNINKLKLGVPLRREITRFIRDWEKQYLYLDPDYQLSINKIRNFLQELSLWIEQGEMLAGINDGNNSENFAAEFSEEVDAASENRLDELFAEYNDLAKNIPDDQIMTHKDYARHELHPLTMCSPFMHRTYTKPLGYAGDYEMVNMILRNKPQGSTTYAKVIDAILLRSGTAQAHRNRIDLLLKYIEQKAKQLKQLNRKFMVLNIGCGPAMEVQRFIQNSSLSNNAHFQLIDFNMETLDYARTEIQKNIDSKKRKIKIEYLHDSIHSLLKKSGKGEKITNIDQYDMVYCAGLFDYLSDRTCKRLVNLFYNHLCPGGIIIITNVSDKHSVKGFLEHLQEWYLILRTETELEKFAPKGSEHCITSEETGINIFLEIRKPLDN